MQTNNQGGRTSAKVLVVLLCAVVMAATLISIGTSPSSGICCGGATTVPGVDPPPSETAAAAEATCPGPPIIGIWEYFIPTPSTINPVFITPHGGSGAFNAINQFLSVSYHEPVVWSHLPPPIPVEPDCSLQIIGNAVIAFPNAEPGQTITVTASNSVSSASLEVFVVSLDTDSNNDGVLDPATDDLVEDGPGKLLGVGLRAAAKMTLPTQFPSSYQYIDYGAALPVLRTVDFEGPWQIRLRALGNIRVWDAAVGGNDITNQTFEVGRGHLPNPVYVEGISGGTGNLTMQILRPAISVPFAQEATTHREDGVNLAVFKLVEPEVKAVGEDDEIYSSDPENFCVGDSIRARVSTDPEVDNPPGVAWKLERKETKTMGGQTIVTIVPVKSGKGVTFKTQLPVKGTYKVTFWADDGNLRLDGTEQGVSTSEFEAVEVVTHEVTVAIHKKSFQIGFNNDQKILNNYVIDKFARATLLLKRKDIEDDVRCCVVLKLKGSVGTFGELNDGHDIVGDFPPQIVDGKDINADKRVNEQADVFLASKANIMIVTDIQACGLQYDPAIDGCTLAKQSILDQNAPPSDWAHEFGHQKGLPHYGSASGKPTHRIMFEGGPGRNTLDQSECDKFRMK